MPKHVKLYEEFMNIEEQAIDAHYSWADIRNTIQSKLPFIIIDFKTVESRDECIEKELFDEKYVKQKYYLKKVDGDNVKYPSVFIFGEETDLASRVQDFTKRFDILRLVIGEFGKDQQQLYVEGEQVDIGKNLMTGIELDEMGLEDFYDIDSKYYKFIG